MNYTGTTATLSFPALPESVYRLTVHDTVTDAVGNQLDGDRNGTPGEDAREEFFAAPPLSGFFGTTAAYPTGNNTSPQSIVAADLNGDGIFDLVTANFASNNVGVLLGNGAGGFAEAVSGMNSRNCWNGCRTSFPNRGRNARFKAAERQPGRDVETLKMLRSALQQSGKRKKGAVPTRS